MPSMQLLPSSRPSREVAGLQGEIKVMAKLCQEMAEPPASKDEDLGHEHITDHRALPECLGGRPQELGGRGPSREA